MGRTGTALVLSQQGLETERLRELVPAGVPLLDCPESAWVRRGSCWSRSFALRPEHLCGLRELLPCCCAAEVSAYRFVLEYTERRTQEAHWLALDIIGTGSELAETAASGGASATSMGGVCGRTVAAPAGRCLQSPLDISAIAGQSRAALGVAAADAGAITSAAVTAEIDLLRIQAPLSRAVLHLMVEGTDPAGPPPPWLVSLSLRYDPTPTAAVSGTGSATMCIDVPPASQRLLAAELAPHVCSPTCVTMVLAYYELAPDIHAVIQAATHGPTGLHGVWPANVQAAARFGLLGYVLHMPCWDAARSLLDRGVPLVASIRFEAGELAGAPITRSSGHLIVLCGYQDDMVIVNDPAAPDLAGVRRRYRREDLEHAWLGHAAVAYVLGPRQRLCG